jgi:glycosidase
MNYPLKNAILSYLLQKNAEDFASTTTTLYAHYPRTVSESLMNLLGTHDTARILNVLGGCNVEGMTYEEMKNMRLSPDGRALATARLRIASAILYTMPGIPCVYYGDEAGMEGGKDPFNRRTYPWGEEDEDILSFFRTLGRYRKEKEQLLSRGYYRVLHAKGGELVITRETDDKTLLLVANASERDVFTYAIAPGYYNALYGREADGHVSLPPLSFSILVKE